MNVKEYIASGILELYVSGALSEEENEAVYNNILKYPELLDEVLRIESAIIRLSSSVAPDSDYSFDELRSRIADDKVPVIDMPRKPWYTYSGWAAAILLAGGMLWTIDQNSKLKEDLQVVERDKQFLEQQIEIANEDLAEAENLISILRDRNILSVPLAGQQVAPEAYAKVYWDKNTNQIYLDAQGLPEPPRGKVYQVWSLKLDPLTPTSLGIIDTFSEDDNKIFIIANANASEAFGITLEPEGGSESPTLEQLYTLGAVGNTP